MPSLALAIVAKKDKLVQTATKKPPRLTIPPDLQSALDLLFFMEEQRTGCMPPSSAWFLAEAFSSQQCRKFRPTQQLQHFLHSLMGDAGYCGPESLHTYYAVVVMGLALKAAVGNEGIHTVMLRCEWCLLHWGYREDRQAYVEIAGGWVSRILGKVEANLVDPCIHTAFKEVRRRVGKLVNNLEITRQQE